MAPNFEIQCFSNCIHINLLFSFFKAPDDEVETALHLALEAGYRHIDTAPVYMNEKAIGRVLKEWLDSGRVKREELFITTKLPPPGKKSRNRLNCTTIYFHIFGL